MRGDLNRSTANRKATRVELARLAAFTSIFAAIVALIVALALDFTCIVPLMAGNDAYNPIRDFLSYRVDGTNGELMTGVFLLLAVAAWSYAAAAFVALGDKYNRITMVATLLFGLGLFVGACFPAFPKAQIGGNVWMKTSAHLHDVGIGGGFIPAMLAAFIDQWKILFDRKPGYLLTKVSFWMILVGAVSTGIAVVAVKGVEGLTQRVFVIGIVLWLISEAHLLFWSCGDA